ncbi:MAG: hypothetical protein WAO55_08955 [Candidatus Manganitrophaceae bacterium]
MAIDRVNYFNGEFLKEEDFKAEQTYHLEMRRRHNQRLHLPGIVFGLGVTAGTGKVTIASGMAIDRLGRELILEASQDLPIASAPAVIGLKYDEQQTMETSETGVPGKKRWTESAVILTAEDPDAIVLAKVTKVTAEAPVTLDPNFKPAYSGPVVPGDLTVQGNLTVQGETTVVKTERMQGNVFLGDADSDTATVEGTLLTGHSSGRLKIGSPTDIAGEVKVTGGGIRWGNNSLLSIDQGGSIELGGDNATAGTGTPYIDFHQAGLTQDFNTRIINDANGRLSFLASIVQVTGQLGIGTAAPVQKLTVSGAETTPNGFGAAVGIENTAPGGRKWYLRTGATGTVTPAGGFSIADDAAYRLSIDSSGNVGIGISDPAMSLQVAKASLWGRPAIGGSFSTAWAYLHVSAPHSLIWNNGTDMRFGIETAMGSGYAERMRITSDGKVGIGTTSPDGKLDVNGDIRAGNSDLYFTKTDHNHTGIGNAAGFAAIENDGGTYKALMILGRSIAGTGRIVKLWDFLQVNGNLEVTGNLGTHGFSPTPRTAGWGGGIHTFDVEAEGTVWSRNGYQSGARDLAENYFGEAGLEPGDVISLHKSSDKIVISQKPNDIMVLGVISTRPGFLLNVDHEGEKKVYPVALCGRVPCKVVDENGAIKRGDLLTSSSTPGHAMKATPISVNGETLYRPGTIIGKALEPLKSGKGEIEIFVFSS